MQIVTTSNIYPHARALSFHAAATHVLRLACEKAVLAGALRPDWAFELQVAARQKMHTAQVRQATELVLALWEEQQRPRLLPAIQATSDGAEVPL